MTKETILPELIGALAELPEHTQKTIKAYGAACYRTALQSEQVQAWKMGAERFSEAFDLLKTLFEEWENGPACYNDGDLDDYIGNAFSLDDKTFHACVAMLNGRNQADAAMEQENDK